MITRGFQDRLSRGGIVFSALQLSLLFVGVYLFVAWDLPRGALRFSDYLPWYLQPIPLPPPETLGFYVLDGILVLLAFSLTANAALRPLYKRTKSPELFFFILFAASLSIENARAGVLLAQNLKLSMSFIETLTRAAYLGRLFAQFSLLISSLYGAGMRYGGQSTLTGLLFLVSLVLASLVPIDATILELNGLLKLGDKGGYWFVVSMFGLLAIGSFLAAALMRENPRFILVAVAVALVFVGKELLYFCVGPWPLSLGSLLLIGGTLLFARMIGDIYLWS